MGTLFQRLFKNRRKIDHCCSGWNCFPFQNTANDSDDVRHPCGRKNERKQNDPHLKTSHSIGSPAGVFLIYYSHIESNNEKLYTHHYETETSAALLRHESPAVQPRSQASTHSATHRQNRRRLLSRGTRCVGETIQRNPRDSTR